MKMFIDRLLLVHCHCCWSSGCCAILGEWVNTTAGKPGRLKSWF